MDNQSYIKYNSLYFEIKNKMISFVSYKIMQITIENDAIR